MLDFSWTSVGFLRLDFGYQSNPRSTCDHHSSVQHNEGKKWCALTDRRSLHQSPRLGVQKTGGNLAQCAAGFGCAGILTS
jgi:hypothetical protein